jgi:DNA-directed RNA polymerase subunit H (RpoH/RPB5)
MSPYAKKTDSFQSLIAGSINIHATSEYRDDYLEIIVVSKTHLSTQIMKFINNFNTKSIQSGGLTTIEVYEYKIFATQHHKLAPPHSIVTEDALEALEARYHFSRVNLSKIRATDAQVAWIGGKVGHVIRYERRVSSVGVVPEYRFCIEG